VPGGELLRHLERGLGESVEQAQAGGGADSRGQPPGGFGDGIVADGGDTFEIGLEAFDEGRSST
jgi:hypothetical protein